MDGKQTYEMKNSVKYHFTPKLIKKKKKSWSYQGWEGSRTLTHWEGNDTTNNVEISLNVKHTPTIWSSILLFDIYPKEKEAHAHTWIFRAALFVITPSRSNSNVHKWPTDKQIVVFTT